MVHEHCMPVKYLKLYVFIQTFDIHVTHIHCGHCQVNERHCTQNSMAVQRQERRYGMFRWHMLHTKMVGSDTGVWSTGTGVVEGGVMTEGVRTERRSIGSLAKGMSKRFVLGLYSGSTQWYGKGPYTGWKEVVDVVSLVGFDVVVMGEGAEEADDGCEWSLMYLNTPDMTVWMLDWFVEIQCDVRLVTIPLWHGLVMMMVAVCVVSHQTNHSKLVPIRVSMLTWWWRRCQRPGVDA